MFNINLLSWLGLVITLIAFSILNHKALSRYFVLVNGIGGIVLSLYAILTKQFALVFLYSYITVTSFIKIFKSGMKRII